MKKYIAHISAARKKIDDLFAQLYHLLPLFSAFSFYFFRYLQKKIMRVSHTFEKQKNMLVRFFLMKRGRYNRPFLHITAMLVLALGVVIAPVVADTYPVFLSNKDVLSANLSQAQEQSVTADTDVFQTEVSQKPRDKAITYTVEPGDTLSGIGKKFAVSTNTIKWANDLTSDSVTVGDELKILPVTGVMHKVAKGDTVYTIAKKYDTEAQKIVDFPFNDFANPETFSLIEGQLLVVPDGVKPSEQPFIKRQVFIATGPVTVSGAGFTWPVRGPVSQFAAWYHMALDITSPVGTPIVSAQSGKVVGVIVGSWDGGYGTNVYVDNGTGYQTHYAHMSGVNVGVGDDVVAGKSVLGWVGLTGRTTGAHLHFEIRKGGTLVDPLAYLQ